MKDMVFTKLAGLETDLLSKKNIVKNSTALKYEYQDKQYKSVSHHFHIYCKQIFEELKKQSGNIKQPIFNCQKYKTPKMMKSNVELMHLFDDSNREELLLQSHMDRCEFDKKQKKENRQKDYVPN